MKVLILLIINLQVILTYNSIFWNDLSSNDMLNIINQIEKKLKIFVYIKPKVLDDYVVINEETSNQIPLNDKIEYLVRDYLFYLHKNRNNLNGSDLSLKDLIVDDPSKANVFLIDHDWSRLYHNNKCPIIYSEYFPIIINNVVDNYPYYNRSNGKDHFIFAMSEQGPFCSPYCDPNDELSIFKRIVNATFIGNYGMDNQYYKDKSYYNPVTNVCHRAGYDIVIPQLLRETSYTFMSLFNQTLFPYRHFDSIFTDLPIIDKYPLERMCNQNDYDYKNNYLENLKCHLDFEKKVTRHDLIFKGYFFYNPCNYGCWNPKMYDSIAHYTIPIVISDSSIQAFEKFINWNKIIVRISLSTWFNESLRNHYRRHIRNETDNYRIIIKDCLNTYNKNNFFRNILYGKEHLNNYNFLSISCNKLRETFIYNKIKYYNEFLQWIDFSNLHVSINGFKLLLLEIYCRVSLIYDLNIENTFSLFVGKYEFICSK